MSESNTLSLEQMTTVRQAALHASAIAHAGKSPAEVAHAAGVYLHFMLNSVPVSVVDSAVNVAQNAGTEAAKKTAAPRKVTAASAPATTAASSTAPAVATSATATAATTIPAPVTLTEAADALRALVNTQGNQLRNRDVAVNLIKSYGVEKMAEIPAAKLADFVQRAKSADPMNLGAAASAGDDVLAGL